MIEFDTKKMSEDEMVEAANRIFTAHEKDFERIKSEKWYQSLFRAITLNQDGKKYAVRGVTSLAKLQQLFIRIYVKNYRKSHEQLDEVIDVVTKNSKAINKMFYICVLNIEKQESLESLSTQDAEILALFLGDYRDENDVIPDKVRIYNRSVLRAINQKVPIGTLDNHQIRELKSPKVVYRCFLEQCAIDGTIDSHEWTKKIYEDLKDFELSQNSKNEIEKSVRYEAEVFGIEYFLEKYEKENSGIFDSDLLICNEQIERQKKDKAAEKKREEKVRIARMFYQRPILIAYNGGCKSIAEYFMGIINDNRMSIDERLPAPIRMDIKEYKRERVNIEQKGYHVIFIGDSDEAKTFYQNTKNGRWDYYKLGMRFMSYGNKSVILTRKLKNKEIDDLIKLAKEVNKRHTVKVPSGVETVHSIFGMIYSDSSGAEDVILNTLASIVLSPVLAMVGFVNVLQGIENSLSMKDLDFLMYSIAIYMYLESKNALLK